MADRYRTIAETLAGPRPAAPVSATRIRPQSELRGAMPGHGDGITNDDVPYLPNAVSDGLRAMGLKDAAHRTSDVTGLPYTLLRGLDNLVVQPIRQYGRIASGRVPMRDEEGRPNKAAVGAAFDVAGAAMTGGIGAVAAGAVPKNAVGIFGGRLGAENLAKTGEARPLRMLQMLNDMEKAGASRDEIWAATAKLGEGSPYAGAMRGVDKQGRFEIDDSGLRARHGNGTGEGLPITHGELLAAYPDLRSSQIGISIDRGHSPRGAYRPVYGERREQLAIMARSPEQARTVAAEELQHAIQRREGFEAGGSPSDFWPFPDRPAFWTGLPAGRLAHPDRATVMVDSAGHARGPNYEEALRLYQRLPGEREAAKVRERLDLSQTERRATPPWQY